MDEPAGEETSTKFPVAAYILFLQTLIRALGRTFLRSVSNLFLRNKLLFTTEESVSLVHGVDMATRFFTPLGALAMSSLTNRFIIILIGTSFTVVARIFIFMGSLPTLRQRIFMYLFWIFDGIPVIIMGGAIASFGGDQFKLPEQGEALRRYYGVIYILANLSVLLAYFFGPLLKTEVACFSEQDCYPFAFGLSVICCITEIITLTVGSRFFVKKKPTQKILINFFRCIGNAIKQWARERKTNPRPHWLDYAEPAYGAQLVEDLKIFFRMLIVLVTLPIFWSVYNQMETKWLYQATRMDGRIGSYTIIPDHYQLLNPLLVLILVPFVTHVLDPMTKRLGMDRVLRRFVVGGLLIASSFIISGFLESKMKQTYPKLPKSDECEIIIINNLNCSIIIQAADLIKENTEIYSFSLYKQKHITIHGNQIITLTGAASCANFKEKDISLKPGGATSIFIESRDGEANIISYEETIDKSETGFPIISVLGVDANNSLTLEDSKRIRIEMKHENANRRRKAEVVPETYKLFLNEKVVLEKFPMYLGGVYMIMLANGVPNIYEIVEPNSVHILWICPQSIVLTLGEVYFAVALSHFLYTESPASLVQVVASLEFFSIGLGDGVIVVLTLFGNMDQDHEYYFSALILTLDMLLLIYLAMRFKPKDPNTKLI